MNKWGQRETYHSHDSTFLYKPFLIKNGGEREENHSQFSFSIIWKKIPHFSVKEPPYEFHSIILIWRRNWSKSTNISRGISSALLPFFLSPPLSFYPHFLQFKSSRPSIVRHLKIISQQLELIEGMIAFLQSKLLHNLIQKCTKIDCRLKCFNDCTEKNPLFRLTL